MEEENLTRPEAVREDPEEAAAPADPAGPDLAESLRLLGNSQGLIRAIFLGLALQYRSLDLQRELLLAQAEDPEALLPGPDPKAVQTAASLVTLCALFGFQRQSEELACQEAALGGCPDLTDVKLGATVILVALIRLIRLQRPAPASPRGETENALIEEEELDQSPV